MPSFSTRSSRKSSLGIQLERRYEGQRSYWHVSEKTWNDLESTPFNFILFFNYFFHSILIQILKNNFLECTCIFNSYHWASSDTTNKTPSEDKYLHREERQLPLLSGAVWARRPHPASLTLGYSLVLGQPNTQHSSSSMACEGEQCVCHKLAIGRAVWL